MSTTSPSWLHRRLPRRSWFLIVPGGLILIVLIVLVILPVKVDPAIEEKEWGAGAVNLQPSWTGLLRSWPEIAQPEFNVGLANLGYQLFFDPVLSGDNKRSCASCHNPDYGFSDPHSLAARPDGSDGKRHSPTLWNVAFNKSFFWDGRVKSLEEQAQLALQSDMELNQPAGEVVKELTAIPEYQQQFETLFPDGVTAENVYKALAAFERTLISDGSPFDRYAEGDFEALTAQQRRGLAIFRSAGTRCFECHSAPTFTDGSFTVIGVPDNGLNDKGRGEVGGQEFAFKVPTLRNVALRGPFMHNGSQKTLEDVIEMYARGPKEITNGEPDRRLTGFTLSTQEKADLIAFLFALTDETLPEKYRSVNYSDSNGGIRIPAHVPSGLHPVAPINNPARAQLAAMSAEPRLNPDCKPFLGEGNTLLVKAGSSIQKAVDCATEGTTILVEPGVYHERVVIDQSGIILRGQADEPSACPVEGPDHRFPSGDAAPKWPILDGDINGDGRFELTDGVIASGNDFKMEYFIIRNYKGNGVLAEGINNVTLRHLFADDTGLYGVYPVHSTNVLVECSVATQVHDAGIYVGQSRDIVMKNNLAYDNVAGLEIENSVNAEVYDNEAWGNTGGLLIFALPNLTSRVSREHRVHDNYVHDNNRPKSDVKPGSVVGLVPVGTGMFVMATDNSEFYHNRLENNQSFGLAVVSALQGFKAEEIAGTIGPLSEGNRIYDNQFGGNGTQPDQAVTKAGLPGADLLWDATGSGNTFDQPGANGFPPVLPARSQPDFWRRILENLWGLLAGL